MSLVERPSWDCLFVSMCYMIAMRSRDLSTHVGSVIVGPDNVIVAMGYNSFPRGIEDEGEIGPDGLPARQSRIDGQKYHWMEHAERNAIYNATRQGQTLKGCRLYLLNMPCTDCARGIIQAGITEVVNHKQGREAFLLSRGEVSTWDGHFNTTLTMFEEAGVGFRSYDGPVVGNLTGFFTGKTYRYTPEPMEVTQPRLIARL